MSQNQNAVLPDPQTAYNNLFEGVHARIFFQKCAAAGYSPRSQEEANYMLETAGKLRVIAESEQVKQASAQNNPYYQMNAGLDRVMEQYGLGQQKQAGYVEQEVGIKNAAAHLMQDPLFYNSVLSLKAAEAEQVKAEYAAWQAQQGR